MAPALVLWAVLCLAAETRGSEVDAYALQSSRFVPARPSESPAFFVDDTLFMLSPGDRLLVRWWGVGSGSENVVVDSRWNLVVPDVVSLHVRNMTFDRVRDTLETLFRKRSNAKMVDVQLSEVANASVQVTGLVPSPGLYEVKAGTRLTKVLEQAGMQPGKLIREVAMSQPPRQGDRYRLPSIRKVALVRVRMKDTLWCDLARAYNGGDPSNDPLVFTGDQVQVVPQGRVVAITGDAPIQGYVEQLPGETLGRFLQAVGVFEQDSAVVRSSDGTERVIKSGDVLPAEVALVKLPPIAHTTSATLVWITGFVERPGGYALEAGMTAQDLVRAAGGTGARSEDSSIVVGIKRGWNWLSPNPKSGMEDETPYPEVRFALREYLNHGSRQYTSPHEPLQPGDSVVVVMAERVVWVGGQVKNPGFVTWKKGATIDDYVKAAGGYGARPWESRAYIYNMYTQRRTMVGEPIEQGSAIIVPEKRYIYPEQWISIAATVASLLIAAWSVYLQTVQ